MFTFSSKDHAHSSVIFDIGNGSIGVAFVSCIAGKLPQILYSYRESFPVSSTVTQPLPTIVTSTLKNVANHFQKNVMQSTAHFSLFGPQVSWKIFCIFSAPWYEAKTSVLSIKKDEPFLITQNIIDDLITTEIDKQKNNFIDQKYKAADIGILEKIILHSKLNGYEIEQPLNKKAGEIELTLYTTLIPEIVKADVEKTLHKISRFKEITFASYGFASWQAIKALDPGQQHFLFIDITNEITTISLTRQGILVDTLSFEIGRTAIIQNFMENLSVPFDVALSFLSMHFSSATEKTFNNKLHQILEKSGEAWFKEFCEKLTMLTKKYSIPRCLFITADSDLSQFFNTVLQRELPLELSVPTNHFDIVVLDSKSIKNTLEYGKQVLQDPFLALETIFITKK